MSNGKHSKSDASYVHYELTEYQCADCPMWIEGNMCLLMSPKDVIWAVDTCNYFVKGLTTSFGMMPLSLIIKEAAGWAHNDAGYSCKRCEYWNPDTWQCSQVDELTPGYDLGLIHPDGCCNFWSGDVQRGTMKTAEFYSFLR